MPELPEVETVVRDLRPHLAGAVIAAVRVSTKALRRPWQPDWSARLVGRRIESVERRGKWIVLHLASPRGTDCQSVLHGEPAGHLVIHLGMTGQLRVHPAGESVRDHTHLILALDGEQELRFRDVRRFGSGTLFADAEALERFFEQAGLGPEPFGLDPAYWRKALARTSRCLKAVLLDQHVVAGVGNIYADEVLFQVRLHPSRHGRDLKAAEADRLRKAIAAVLERAIEKRGSTIRDYVGGFLGLKGGYQEEFRVYGRTAAPCPRCRTPIARIRLAGRSTHYCPRCQKE